MEKVVLIFLCVAASGQAGTQLSPPSYGVGPDVKLLGEDTAVQYIIDEGKITGNKTGNSTNPTTIKGPTVKTTKSPSTTEKQQTQTTKTDKPIAKSEEDKNKMATSTAKTTELNTMKSTVPPGQEHLTSEASMGKSTAMTTIKQPTTEDPVESTPSVYSSAQNNMCNIWLISAIILIYSNL